MINSFRSPSSHHSSRNKAQTATQQIDLIGSLPFFSIHLAALAVIWVGFSWTALLICIATYYIRMFGITAGFHRYFSHRTFKTGRVFQFLLALIGTSSAQKGPLWWAAYHRHHHRHSDTDEDIHSPGHKGFWWSHIGWVLCPQYNSTLLTENIRDWMGYPELRWLDRFHMLPPLALALGLVAVGYSIENALPHLQTTMWQTVVWGFFMSTVLLYHFTFSINTFAHLVGSWRFETKDSSCNSFLLSLLTMGEGWHNNHHRYPGSERQGFYWWEVDFSHYILTTFNWAGLVWDIKKPPQKIYEEANNNKSGNTKFSFKEMVQETK